MLGLDWRAVKTFEDVVRRRNNPQQPDEVNFDDLPDDALDSVWARAPGG